MNAPFEYDDDSVVGLLVDCWLDLFEAQEWDCLEDEFGDNAAVFVSTGRGDLRHLVLWSDLAPEWKSQLRRPRGRDVLVEVDGARAVAHVRSGPEQPWPEAALFWERRGRHWQLTQ